MRKNLIIIITAVTLPMFSISPVMAISNTGAMSSDAKKAELKSKVESLKLESQEKIKNLKSKVAEKTLEVRTKACEARKTNIKNRLDNRVDSATKHKAKFDSIYKRVDDFAATKKITSTEITNLGSAADVAATKVDTEISTLKELNIDINCAKPDEVASAVDSFKSQVENVRSALKDYREAIRKYSQAVKSKAESADGQQL